MKVSRTGHAPWLLAIICAVASSVSLAQSGLSSTVQVADSGGSQSGSRPGLGPAMTAYMGFIDDEEAELRYHLENDEISAPEYRLASSRLEATRQSAIRIARQRKEDVVPELYVMQPSELGQVLPEGEAAVRGKRPGAQLNDTWIYHGTIRRGVVFHILERIGSIRRAPLF